MARTPKARALRADTPVKREQEKKEPAVERLAIPAALLLAAESIAAKADKDKSNLQAILVHQQKDDSMGRVVGCDGHRLFVGSFSVTKPPAWLKAGLMLPRDDLKVRVNMIAKVAESETVLVGHAKGTQIAVLSDVNQTMMFQLHCGQNVTEFPEYESAFRMESFTDITEEGDVKTKREWEPVGFNSQHLKHCGDIAKILESGIPKEARSKNGMVVRCFDSDPSSPRVFDFDGWPGAVLVIAGMEVVQKALPVATARILAPAVKLTVAALRAHATRWTEASEKAATDAEREEAKAKAAGFQARVAAILACAEDPKLSGPKKEADGEQPKGEEPDGDGDEPSEQHTESTPPEKATRRRKIAATVH